MNVRNWNFFSRREIKEHILDTVSLWGSIGLLWYAFVSIIREHFPDFLWTIQRISMDWWIIFLWIFILWLGYEWPGKYWKKLIVPCRLAGIAIPVAYIVVKLEKIIDGFWQLIAVYLPHVNSYYKTRFYLEAAHSGENSVVAFTFLSMILWWISWLLAYGMKKRVLLALFPVFAVMLELLVGLSPQGMGIVYLFMGAMLLAIMGGSSIMKRAVVIACVGITLLLSKVWFGEDIQRLATEETKQALLRWQNNLNIEVFNPFKLSQIDLHFDWEVLDNNTPQYTGKVVLEVESSPCPTSIIYLRGFYGTIYEGGNWTYDASAFEEACVEDGKTPEEVAAEIFQMPYDRMQQYYGAGDYTYKGSNRDKRCMYRIFYTGTTGDVAYVPYLSDYTSLDEAYSLRGDYLVEKSIWDDTIQLQGLTVTSDYYHWGHIFNFSYEVSDWLDDLADAYLQVPEDAEFIEEAAAKVENTLTDEMYLAKYDGVNAERIMYASAVTQFLADQMSYSLKLDNLPMGRDPIEYALTESHEGYCMHFASAATLILRELGVPARYVSGYAVDPSAFSYQSGAGAYMAQITDYMAHTWVEIYLDNIGWVPVEATPGSSLDSLPTDEEIQRWESLSNAHRQALIDQENETEESEQSSDNTETATEEAQENSEENTQDTTSENITDDQVADDKEMDGDTTKQILLVLGRLGFGSVVVLIAVIGAKRWIGSYEALLVREIEKTQTRKAIKRINRRLYRMLRISNGRNWFMKQWSDAEYKDALVEAFTSVTEDEWNHYMDIVKKNHYSHEKVSVEEMEFCYECYKKVGVFNKSLTK